MTRFTRLSLFLLSTLPALASAQSTKAQPLTEKFKITVDYAGSGGLQNAAGTDLGDISVTSYGGSVQTFRPLDRAGRGLIFGLEWTEFSLDLPTAAPLPETLRQVSLVAGLNYPLSKAWNLGVFLRPGVYSDGADVGGDDFNVPAMLFLSYQRSDTLSWLFGLRADAFSKYPVIPFVGVRWAFAPDWEFSIGLPRTGLAWEVSDGLTLRAGANVSGGGFQVETGGVSGAEKTPLDYREIRLGGGLDYRLGESLTLSVDIATIVDRQFDYFDVDQQLDGENALAVSIGLSGRF